MRKERIIFLDIDGVLNGYGTATGIMYKIFSKLHLLKFVKKHYDLFDVKTRKVRLLSKIVKSTDAKVVLSSSWRNGYFREYDDNSPLQKMLKDKLNRFCINVVGTTGRDPKGRREYEIQEYLENHKSEISSFVIIDDESFGIKSLFPDRFVKTSSTESVIGAWYENTGLKRKHVMQAIDILRKEL